MVILSKGIFLNLWPGSKVTKIFYVSSKSFIVLPFIFIPIVHFKIDFYVMVWGRDQDSVFPNYIISEVQMKTLMYLYYYWEIILHGPLVCMSFWGAGVGKCHTACRILVYKPGTEPMTPWSPESPNHGLLGSPCSSPLWELAFVPNYLFRDVCRVYSLGR